MKNKAINTAVKLCDTMIKNYPDAAMLPPEHRFFYHQGVFLSGMNNIYELCHDEKYIKYIKSWVDSLVDENGRINSNCPTNWLDDIQPGILLYPLYKKTGEEKYKVALDYLMNVLRNWKTNKSGGFWHSMIHPDQMWLDSLYMGCPIQAEYAATFGEKDLFDRIANQAIVMFDNMRDKESGLMYHAWDESRKAEWCDPITGLSPEIWGRAQGWYVVAMLDILSFMPMNHPSREKLIEIEREILNSLIKCRDEKSKLWYQIVNKGEQEGNWIETSCSCLFIAALAKAVKMGIIDKKYKEYVNECFEGALNYIDQDENDIYVSHVCVGTCIYDYQGYIDRPTCTNDLHGVGAFLLMCAEVANIN